MANEYKPGEGDPRRCQAKSNRAEGGQCRRWAMKGQTVCPTHGGRAPQNRAAAERRQTEERIEKELATYGRPIETTPTEALLEEVKWTAGHVAWLRQRIGELEQDQLSWGKTEEVDKGSGEFAGTDITHAAAPPVLLDLYQRERTHLVKVCATAISAGIEERRVRLAQAQGDLIAGVIQAILGDLHLTPEQQALVPEVVPHHLRLSISAN